MRKILVLVVLAAGLAAVTGFAGAKNALAYGKADQPLAQLTVSANCDNPSFPLCAPPGPDGTGGVGLGGIWAWVEIDTGGGGDMTGAACGHAGAGGGGSGAGPLGPTEITWTIVHAADIPPMFFQLGVDPNDQYYKVSGLPFAFPVTPGHYSTRLAPGVQIQSTTAP